MPPKETFLEADPHPDLENALARLPDGERHILWLRFIAFGMQILRLLLSTLSAK